MKAIFKNNAKNKKVEDLNDERRILTFKLFGLANNSNITLQLHNKETIPL